MHSPGSPTRDVGPRPVGVAGRRSAEKRWGGTVLQAPRGRRGGGDHCVDSKVGHEHPRDGDNSSSWRFKKTVSRLLKRVGSHFCCSSFAVSPSWSGASFFSLVPPVSQAEWLKMNKMNGIRKPFQKVFGGFGPGRAPLRFQAGSAGKSRRRERGPSQSQDGAGWRGHPPKTPTVTFAEGIQFYRLPGGGSLAGF